jgi:CheY-like chemotaxis protein
VAASEGRGQGAAFTVRMPLGGIQEDLDETGVWLSRPRSAGSMPSPAPTRSLSILLVEDHPDTAEAMADLLGLSGHQITIAGSVGEALAAAAAAAGGFDLVLSDLGLPDGSGQDLMRELVRLYGLKGIALSGYGMEEDIRRSREAGFARHLTKPVNRQALEAAIRQVVSGA